MKGFQFFLVIIACGLFTQVAGAKTIHVPGDSSTIQSGITGAVSDDTVLVAPGTYYQTETLWLKDSVRVQGAGIDLSVIEASPDTNPLWTLIRGAWGAELEGFTIVGTDTTDGIFAWGDSMVISKNKITGCQTAIDVGTNAVITENVIVNIREWGIFCGDYHDTDLGPLISRNLIIACGSDGITSVSSNIMALNNTINNNHCGIWVQQSPDDTTAVTVTVKSNIVSNNDWYGVYPASGDPYGVDTSLMTINYNDVWSNPRNYCDNWAPDPTDISEDPLFVLPLWPSRGGRRLSQFEISEIIEINNKLNTYYTSLAKGQKPGPRPQFQLRLTTSVLGAVYDYHLKENSPCIDKGDPNPIYNDPDGTRNDMGAYYFDQSDTLCIYPTHFVFRDSTGDSYSIVIDSALLDGLQLEDCDEVGVFDSGLCVGASVYYPDSVPIALVAWQDDPQTPEQDGYTCGNPMSFRVWKRNQDREECTKTYYEIGDGPFCYGAYSKLWLEAVPCEECQHIALHEGWQWVSSYIQPDPADIESVFADCWNLTDIVVACDGSFCIPGVICNIPGWNVLEMYKVHMNSPCALEVCGDRVPVDSPIALSAGWGCISYLPDCPLEPDFALASIWSCLDIVKNDAGEFCIPGVICTIDCMEPGEGYKVHMACADNLIYPTSCPPCPPPFAKQAPYSEALTPTHFNYIGNTGESYSIVIDSISLDSENPTNGDEIGVFTSGGLCVGASVWEDQLPLALVAWKDDPQTTEIDGYIFGDTMHFKFWDSSEVIERGLKPLYSVGDGTFGCGSHSRLSLNISASAVEDFSEEISYSSFLLSQNYPNPFNPMTTIIYFLPESYEVGLIIYNITGQKVKTLVNEYQTKGLRSAEWDGKDEKGKEVSSGIYFYNIKAGDFIQTKKMVLLR